MKPVIYCSNPIVNAVLVNKVHQCEEKDIKFTIDIKGIFIKKQNILKKNKRRLTLMS